MSRMLMVIGIGPVQGFISAARRTRDLWFGSEILCDVSRTVAKTLQSSGGDLIFPADPDAAGISNFVLAQFETPPKPPADLVVEAKSAGNAKWLKYAAEAETFGGKLLNSARWESQRADVLEFYSAWASYDTENDYPQVRERLMRVLSGRKSCRDFGAGTSAALLPKSSLSGLRDTILIVGSSRQETRSLRERVLSEAPELAQRLRLSEGEELDVADFVKRSTRGSFPSVTRVAVDPWLRGIEHDGGEARAAIGEIAELCQGNKPFATGTGDYFRSFFPFDGSVLLEGRARLMVRQAKRRDDSSAMGLEFTSKDVTDLQTIAALVQKVKTEQEYGEPQPYLAILLADGDGIGKLLSSIRDSEAHRQFSSNLSLFSETAKELVDRQHCGCLVYSGGDDVLAMIPVDQALSCARRLHEEFRKTWKQGESAPTLSVGIAIGHCAEPLEDLLQYARIAERSAKKPLGNGLAIHLHPRSGSPIFVRGPWGDKTQESLDLRMSNWCQLFADKLISGRSPYDIRNLAFTYADWPDDDNTATAIRADIRLVLSKKRPGGKKMDDSFYATHVEHLLSVERDFGEADSQHHARHHVGLMGLANEWLIARHIAASIRQAGDRQAERKALQEESA